MTARRPWLGLAGWVLLCFAAAGLGSVATAHSIPGWYDGLAKPSWTPPAWLFGPVWTVLYLAMAVAAWLVWRPGGFGARRTALGLFLVQLALNVAWSALFFGLRRPDLGLADIGLLWVAIVFTLLAFRRSSRLAGWLFVPYLLWVSFASALNFAIWRMN